MSIAVRRFQRASTPPPANGALYSLWPLNPTPATVSASDTDSIELGVQFSSSIECEVTAIRFYKSTQNTGTHYVSLWDSTGDLLVQQVATGETVSGWQEITLEVPMLINAGEQYTASYFAPVGRYSVDSGYFTPGSVVSGPLTGTVGVYRYGAVPAYPTGIFGNANYWVDIVARSTSEDQTSPSTPSNLQAVVNGQLVSLTWSASTDDSGVASYNIYRDGDLLDQTGLTTYDDSSVAPSTGYTYTVQAVDFAANQSLESDPVFVTIEANTAPTASFTAELQGRTLFVDGTASSDSDGTIAQWDWDFGDGATATGEYAEHMYSGDGDFTVQLTVTDNSNGTDTTSQLLGVLASSFQADALTTPSALGYPDETNTGVPGGTVLTDSGSLVISTNGAVVENLRILGSVSVTADNVTIRNCHIIHDGFYPLENSGTNLLVEDCEIEGTNEFVTTSIGFTSYTIRRSNLHGAADGTKSDSDVLIEDCFIHDLAIGVDTHNDGTQSTGGSNVTLRHNTYRLGNQPSVSACIQLGNEGGPNSNWLVEDNLLDGGGWTINASEDPDANENMRFLRNRFTRRAGFGAGFVAGSAWFGNYYDDDSTLA